VVRLLLQYEASTNVVDAKGSSPLHLAAWAGDAEIVRLILSQGPSVPKVNLAVSSLNVNLMQIFWQSKYVTDIFQDTLHFCNIQNIFYIFLLK